MIRKTFAAAVAAGTIAVSVFGAIPAASAQPLPPGPPRHLPPRPPVHRFVPRPPHRVCDVVFVHHHRRVVCHWVRGPRR
jgi:hypothetical protein